MDSCPEFDKFLKKKRTFLLHFNLLNKTAGTVSQPDLFIYLLTYLFIYLFIDLFIYLLTYLFIY